ncbi:TPA: FKBP-type peptidyl-prolyl cis-trans isomerase [Salmonella enterica]|nr:FKBP-type peptidyl-prolyl cis-trans isomerase [Salmonella enterica]
MNRKQTTFLLVLVIGLMCGGKVLATIEDNGLPGVLKYAQKYEENHATEAKKAVHSPSITRVKSSATSVHGERVSELRRSLQQRERELKKLREENSRLQKSVAELKTTVSSGTAQILQTCTEKVKQQTESREVTLTALKKQILEKENQNRKQKSELEICLTSVQQEGKRADQFADDNKVLTAKLAKEKKRQSEEMQVIQAEALDTPERKQTYAAGVMLGRDIQTLQEAQMLLGLNTDNRILIAGLNDALSNRVLLNGDTLDEALTEAEESARKATLNVIADQKKAGAAWLATFRKGKGVKQAKSGFWYRLDYAGDGALIDGDASTVEVVVTEKLTDGTVVEDMDARGRSLSMALGDYPPLFREALMLMKNHGTMTIVVPPEQAYGSEGYPPKVPPGATMVYILRVDNVKFAPDIILPSPNETGKMTDDRRGKRKP